MVLIFGIVLAIIGIALLGYMAIRAKAVQKLPENERQAAFQTLVVLNFAGIGLGVMGIMMVIVSFLLS